MFLVTNENMGLCLYIHIPLYEKGIKENQNKPMQLLIHQFFFIFRSIVMRLLCPDVQEHARHEQTLS